MAGKALLVEILGDATQFGRELDKAAGKTRQMGRVAGVAGLALAGGLAIGLEKSVKAAMEGEKSQAALDTALKNTHQSVEAMKGPLEDAEAASRKLGFADDETRASLAKLEIATGNTKESTKELTTAQDLARLKSVSLETATRALVMAHAGSYRAIKQLGIAMPTMTEAVDKVKIAFKKHTGALYDNALATAKAKDKQDQMKDVLALVEEKVHGQAGAFADTAKGGMEQYHAQMEHLEETMGKGLLPVLTQIATKLANVASFFAEHTTTAKVFAGAIATIAGALIAVSVAEKVISAATKIWAAAQWLLNIALDANPIGLVVIAIALLVGGLILAWKHSETFRNIVTGAFDAVKEAGQAVADFVTEKIPAAFDAVLGWVKSNWPIIASLIFLPFAPLILIAGNAFGIRDKLEGAFTAIKDWVGLKVGEIVGFFGALPDRLWTAFNSAWTTVKELVSGVFTAVKDWAGEKVGNIISFFGNLPSELWAALSGAWGSIKGNVLGLFTAIKDWAGEKVGDIVAFFGGLPARLWNALSGAWTNIKADVLGLFNEVKTHAKGIVDDVVDFFRDMPGRVADAVRDKAGELWDGVKHIFDKLPGFVKDALGISSPSKVFMEIGENIVAGAIEGIKSKSGSLLEAAWKMFKSIGGSIEGTNLAEGLVPQVMRALAYARQHGWSGTVTSGFRSHEEQQYLWDHAAELGLIRGISVAQPGTSSHETGQAVDVSQYEQFGAIMAGAPPASRLYNFLGAADPVHYSVSGYAKGGIFTAPTLGVIGEAGPEAVIPLNKMGGGVTNVFHFHGHVWDKPQLMAEIEGATFKKRYRGGLTV